MKAKIFEIKRFAVHDGDGIRTTVFFKGCPLKCLWCHNPEGVSSNSELAYLEHKCINCGECISACKYDAHKIVDGKHYFDRSKCTLCGSCVEACLGEALVFYGKEVTVETLIDELLKDKAYYDNSGGGVTLSGGECLLYADFCAELLKRLKSLGVNTAVDTCGYYDKSILDKVINYTDEFLFDVKAIDEVTHIKCTGKSNNTILENLLYIDSKGVKIEVRIPFVPEYNDGEIEKIGLVLSRLKNLTGVKVLAYHNYAGSKYQSLDMVNTLPSRLPTSDQLENAKNILRKFNLNVL